MTDWSWFPLAPHRSVHAVLPHTARRRSSPPGVQRPRCRGHDGDRFSGLDLTVGIADEVAISEILNDWTRSLITELAAVRLANLQRGRTIYRVFLLPQALQFDLSMTPASQFGPAGPRFRLIFGQTTGDELADPPNAAPDLFISTPAVPDDLLGWVVIYGLHARGYDDLPAETLGRFAPTHVGAIEPEALRAALAGSISALLHEAARANAPPAEIIADPLAELQ